MHEEFDIASHLQGFFSRVLTDVKSNENEVTILQLLAFTHYHFLFASTCLMRCHLSESFASVRAAIDGALIAAQIIHDRDSQADYIKKIGPFENFTRYLGNLTRDGKPLPHRLVPLLREIYKQISTFSVHADAGAFVHRTHIPKQESDLAQFAYFQFAKTLDERKLNFLTAMQIFVYVLNVFSDFLVNKHMSA